MKHRTALIKPIAIAITALSLATPLAATADTKSGARATSGIEAQLQEAWLLGKLETALLMNQHLNSFAIDSDVAGNTAILTGTVESGIDRDLAGEVALSINGIDKVVNKLKIVPVEEQSDAKQAPRPTLGQRVNDVTITAAVKTRLVANPHIDGLGVNVDTDSAVVTLSGAVRSSEEKQLAELIARNTADVIHVNNELQLVN